MNNIQRLEMETKGIQLDQSELIIYLEENDLQPHQEYNAKSATNKRNIYKSALSVLESIANSPETLKNIKSEELSVSDFATNIQNRIDQLEYKIRMLKTDEQAQYNSNTFFLFDR
ncbi:hypothetical protein [Lentibacillus amyloliquefaciens]|uniref:Uncharacterized protein n=1 Tax=Lentibacillus amyloliquefaciens TaxID=1472767 RepID=A0A0U3NM28_9BACI|nr:hypothetical protein [Lentibacillus amyloliquefaciens]ALX47867.1 hypothetical protein AOX59_04165 [Lentibacillus amyloliquefaciens]